MTKAHLNDFVRSRPGIARFVPNSVTALALCCGLVSIRFSIEQQFDHAIAAIIIAALLDGIDGRLARKLEACSRFGEEFDSLADFLSFGVAPVVLLFFWSEEHMTVLLSVSLMVFVVASATRLARFNAQAAEPGARWRNLFHRPADTKRCAGGAAAGLDGCAGSGGHTMGRRLHAGYCVADGFDRADLFRQDDQPGPIRRHAGRARRRGSPGHDCGVPFPKAGAGRLHRGLSGEHSGQLAAVPPAAPNERGGCIGAAAISGVRGGQTAGNKKARINPGCFI